MVDNYVFIFIFVSFDLVFNWVTQHLFQKLWIFLKILICGNSWVCL
uniref:Uncharacterized protein n=1 Tax=Manihot esculenta TaxID=3983 RepID=A0A2C9VSY7_MANES